MQALAAKMAVLEGTEDAVVTSSGMAAISGTLMALLRPQDHLMIQACGLLGSHSGYHPLSLDVHRRPLPCMQTRDDLLCWRRPMYMVELTSWFTRNFQHWA